MCQKTVAFMPNIINQNSIRSGLSASAINLPARKAEIQNEKTRFARCPLRPTLKKKQDSNTNTQLSRCFFKVTRSAANYTYLFTVPAPVPVFGTALSVRFSLNRALVRRCQISGGHWYGTVIFVFLPTGTVRNPEVLWS